VDEDQHEEARYFEVTPQQRLIMGGMYFGLIALLVAAMVVSKVQTEKDHGSRGETISYLDGRPRITRERASAASTSAQTFSRPIWSMNPAFSMTR